MLRRPRAAPNAGPPASPGPPPTGRPHYVSDMSAPEPTVIHGSVEPGFEAVRAAFEDNFATQGDVGASVAITIGGQTVVDLWGGTATFDGPDDDEAGVPGVEGDWQEDTIINVWSTTKTMAALVCLVLADRGELDLVRTDRHLLARVRRQRQGTDRHPPRARPHRRAARAGTSRST